jgi:hypothetical protein
MPIHDWTRVDAGIFHHFHLSWIPELAKALNDGLLPPSYYALGEQIAGPLGPDVLTLQVPSQAGLPLPEHLPGAMAVVEVPPKVQHVSHSEKAEYTRRKRSLVIRHVSGHRIVPSWRSCHRETRQAGMRFALF